MRRRTLPGSIYADRGNLYIALKGIRYATGLKDNKEGRRRAEILLEKHWSEQTGVKYSRIPLVSEAFKQFEKEWINRSEKTMSNYVCGFKAIVRQDFLLSEDNIREAVLDFLKAPYFKKNGVNERFSQVSIFDYITGFQVFLNFCYKKKWLPIINLKSDYKVKAPEIEVKEWELYEIQKLLKHLKGQIKNLILFQMFTGARLVDALNFRQSDLKGNLLEFKNKITKKSEIVPVSYFIQKLLTNYVPPVSYSGKSFLHKKLKRACIELGIEQNGRSFQEFRIYYRMFLIKKGLPEPYIQYLMRHSSLRITGKFYTNHNIEEISKLL